MEHVLISEPPGTASPSAAPSTAPAVTRRSTRTEDDRPPSCPSCGRRLVILSTRIDHDVSGESRRVQLWGCPRGHATARRLRGRFLAVEVLPDPLRPDDDAAR